MNSKQRLIVVTMAMVVIAAIVWWLQLYRFYGITADNQFLLDMNWAKSHLLCPSGLALIISSFFTQFFIYPTTGVLVSTAIYAIVILLLTKIMDNQRSGYHLYGLTMLPVVFLFLSVENSNYSFHGHIAFMMVVVALWLYDMLHEKMTTKLSCIIGFLTGILLYWTLGTVTMAFCVGVILHAVIKKGVPYFGILSMCGLLIMACLAVASHIVTGFKEALTPIMYYNWPSSFFFQIYAWVSLVLCIVIDRIVKQYIKRDKTIIYISLIIVIVIMATGGNMFRMIYNGKTYMLRHEGYLADHDDWDGIIKLHKGDKQPVFFISYLNLALAKKGELSSHMSQYNQMDVNEKLGWQPTSRDGLQIKSCVYYHLGYLSAARQAAFELNMVTPGSHNPSELIKLATINEAMGEAKVANKYLSQAHKAPLFANKKLPKVDVKNPGEDRFLEIDGLMEDLSDIVKANKGNEVAKQFFEAYKKIYERRRRE